jgi:tetratricopeptide (TPR) repeat protein
MAGAKTTIIRFTVTILAGALVMAAFAPPSAAKPLLALYDLLSADDSSRSILPESNQWLKSYLRDLGKVDVIQVRADMTSVKRAISEGLITAEQVTRVQDPSERQKIAAAIGADYALGGAIALKDGQVSLAVELLDVKSGKKWPGTSSVSVTGVDPVKSLTNGIQSATNTVVAQLSGEALQTLPKTTAEATPPVENNTDDSTAATNNGEAARRAQQGKQMLERGNVAGAIYELRRAVQSDPQNPDYRIMLARAYMQRNMYDEALAQLTRVTDADPSNLEALKTMAEVYDAKGTPTETMALYQKLIAQKPEDAKLRSTLGDLLWKKARIDDAIKSYEAAAALDPKSVDVHDKLARCYAAKSQFIDSTKQLDLIATLDPKPDPATVAARYSGLMTVAETEIKSISNQFDQGATAYANEEHTREQYYEMIRGLTVRADTLTKFLDKVTVPPGASAAHAHRILACSLLSQAGDSLAAYLETNKADNQTESQLYLNEAKKELSLAAGGTLPAPAPATTEDGG